MQSIIKPNYRKIATQSSNNILKKPMQCSTANSWQFNQNWN